MDTPEPSERPVPLWLLVAMQAGVSAASLVVEIVAGRMIAPYVGMSLYTWTAIIAVVLAGFSAGHWWGGRIAGHATAPALRRTGLTLFAAAATTAAAILLMRWIAGPLLGAVANPLAAILTLSATIFFLPSLFAGVPAPVLAVIAMRGAAKDSGRSEHALGVMFAAGAVGAILGTLLAGFVLVPRLGSVATMLVITALYAGAGLVCFALAGTDRRTRRATVVNIGALALLGALALAQPPICDRESSYYCIRTVTLSDDPDDPVRLMVLDHLAHGISAEAEPRVMFTDHTAMLDALPRMRMGDAGFSSFHIGGGSYSVPRAWADRGIGDMTVAEIDPAVTDKAIADFWFDPATAEVIHRDARVVLREDPTRYDVIVGDSFTDIAVPEHLVTREFFDLVAQRLTPDGIYVMNLIDNVGRLDALAAVLVTLGEAFPSVEVWTEARPPEPGERRVFVLLASGYDSPVSALTTRTPEPKTFSVLAAAFLDEVIAERTPQLLTDDRAPFTLLMGLDPVLH